MIKATILCENTAGYESARECLSEWGLSIFLETADHTNILFDTGHTDVYMKNAAALNIDINDANFVVLSHHHWDHSGGLRFHPFQTKKKMVIHPQVLSKMPKDEAENIKNTFEIITTTTPIELTKNVYYLGEIPRLTHFETGMHKNDAMLDDSAIAIRSENGAIVITGCSHAGICNICEYAKHITGQKLYAVMGGFHLFENDQTAVEGTINYFKVEAPKYLYPMHCVDFPTLSKLHAAFNITKVSTGDSIVLQ